MLLSVVIISFILTYDLNKKITETIDFNKSFSSKLEYTVYYNLIDPIRTIFLDDKNTNSNSVRKNITLFTSVHESHYKTAYKMFEQNKFFGVGNKMFRKLCGNKDYYYNEYSCSTHPHNTYLQILAENGLVGIVFITTIFIYIAVILFKEFIVRNFKKIKTLDDKALLILIGIFLNLWPIIPSGNFFNNWLSILIYFLLDFLYCFNKNQNE